jgi:hypothetical protein
MVIFLLENFISFIENDHFKIWQINRNSSADHISNPVRYRNNNLLKLFCSLLSDANADASFFAACFYDGCDLSDQLSSVSHNDNLRPWVTHINSHDSRDTKWQCLTGSVCGLKQEILAWAWVNIWNWASLNFRRFITLHVFEAFNKFLW